MTSISQYEYSVIFHGRPPNHNTVDRYGPVRAVRADVHHGLVFEVAFEGLQRFTRHKSGVAMRFPRISRIRWEKPAGVADALRSLERLLEQMAGRRARSAGRPAP